jgi:hypothetical protein
MALGEGKYDAMLARALADSGARCGILMVADGDHGPGFSVHATASQIKKLPLVLRAMADQIEADAAEVE